MFIVELEDFSYVSVILIIINRRIVRVFSSFAMLLNSYAHARPPMPIFPDNVPSVLLSSKVRLNICEMVNMSRSIDKLKISRYKQ